MKARFGCRTIRADYLYKTIYPRHGADVPPNYAPFTKVLDEITDHATK